MKSLDGIKVAILATDMYEESELEEPRRALDEAGATTTVISPEAGKIQGARHFDKGGQTWVDLTLDEADPADFDGVLLPGGALNADLLRANPQAQSFVQEIDAAGKPIAVICHGPWLLVSAGLVKGRQLTSFHTIADDIKNAGGRWSDAEVVEDGNWISSRKPDDIPAFNAAMLKSFARIEHPVS